MFPRELGQMTALNANIVGTGGIGVGIQICIMDGGQNYTPLSKDDVRNIKHVRNREKG